MLGNDGFLLGGAQGIQYLYENNELGLLLTPYSEILPGAIADLNVKGKIIKLPDQ